MRFCPNCGNKVGDNDKFCENCGSKLRRVCENCREELSGNGKFCPNCGSPVNGGGSSSSQPVMPQNGDFFDFAEIEAGLDEQLKAQAEYDKKLALAQSFIIRKRYHDARTVYDNLIENDPTDLNGYLGYIRIASQNYTAYEGQEIDEAIAAAKTICGTDNLGQFDAQFADYEEKRKAYFKQKQAKEAAARKAEELRVAEEKRRAAEAEQARSEEERRRREAAKFKIENGRFQGYFGTDLHLIIPDGITSIDGFAFSFCRGLESVTLPDSLTKIDEKTFSNLKELKAIWVSEKHPTYRSVDGVLYSKDGKTLVKCGAGKTASPLVILDGVTAIGANALEGCAKITGVAIPNSVTAIGFAAFVGCENLKSVTLPKGVLSIANSTFASCANLVSVTLPDGVTSIGSSAFGACYKLTEITIPSSVNFIGRAAFYGCGVAQVKLKNPNGWSFVYGGRTTLLRGDLISDPATAAKWLSDSYYNYNWERK